MAVQRAAEVDKGTGAGNGCDLAVCVDSLEASGFLQQDVLAHAVFLSVSKGKHQSYVCI